MTLIRANAILPVSPRFFDDYQTKGRPNLPAASEQKIFGSPPPINLIESPEAYLLEISVPGFEKADFRIELHDETLTIQSERDLPKSLAAGNRYLRQEINLLNFQRSFHVAKTVINGEQIAAKYEAGILQIILPKKEEAKSKPPRTIEIN